MKGMIGVSVRMEKEDMPHTCIREGRGADAYGHAIIVFFYLTDKAQQWKREEKGQWPRQEPDQQTDFTNESDQNYH